MSAAQRPARADGEHADRHAAVDRGRGYDRGRARRSCRCRRSCRRRCRRRRGCRRSTCSLIWRQSRADKAAAATVYGLLRRPDAILRLMLISVPSPSGCGLLVRSDRAVDHEQAEAGDVLADIDRQRIVVARHGVEKERPELAVEQQRIVEFDLAAIPAVADGLKLRRRLEQQRSFEVTRARRFLCYVFVGLRARVALRKSSSSYSISFRDCFSALYNSPLKI